MSDVSAQDERLRAAVLAHLRRQAGVEVSDIEVRVEQGQVHLEGTVQTVRERQAAEAAIGQVRGVAGVDSRLRVAPGAVLRPAEHRFGGADPSPADAAGMMGAVGRQPSIPAAVPPATAEATERTATGEVTTDQAAAPDVQAGVPSAPRSPATTHRPGSSGGTAGAPTADRAWQLTEGMPVFDSQGEILGTVAAIGQGDFRLDRLAHSDVYVPFDAIQDTGDERVTLGVRADDVDRLSLEQGRADAAEVD